MRAKPSLASRLTMAALISALAAVLMVAVGPGLADQPDDAGTPNENASEQAQEATSEDPSDTSASEESSETTEEAADTTASEDATEVAATDTEATEEHVPPGQEKKEEASGEEASTDTAVLDATSQPGNSGEKHVNEDTSQTGLPRGQSADECTNKHQGADPQQGGANQNPGPYDNTCDGRASENGSGGGNASGRPCMGCVGNADDKNPPGQLPNGKDHNAGYECDRNKGVGQGNPAHTDCQSSTPLTFKICHFNGNDAQVMSGLTQAQRDQHLADHDDDFEIKSNSDLARCKDVEDDKFSVCHVDGDDFTILDNLTQAQRDQHLADHDDDFEINSQSDREDCEDDEELCPDGTTPMPPGGSKDCPKKIYICHSGNGKHYVLIHVSVNAQNGHGHENHSFDKIGVPANTNPEDCVDEEPETFDVCHVDGNDFDIIEGLTAAQLAAHLNDHDDDFEIEDAGDRADCVDEDEEFDVCHVDGNDATILENLTAAQLAGHLNDHDDDFEIEDAGDRARCVDDDVRYELCHVDGGDATILTNLTEAQRDQHLNDHDDDFQIDDANDRDRCVDEDERYVVCHVEGDDFDVVSNLTQAQRDAHLNDHSDDFEIDNDDDLDDCDDPDDDNDPDRDTICHSLDGENWDVITDDDNDIDDHLDDHPFDFRVPRGTDEDECEDDEEFCPEGTDLEGEAMPDDGECDLPPVINPAVVCPADSDMAGMPVPGGVLANCWPPSVLPGLVERPIEPVVEPARIPGRPPTEQPGVLPFTGASVLAFLVLALQLIAAGALIMRGKKA